jgi:tetratricopeptide (TPR) repeat protein
MIEDLNSPSSDAKDPEGAYLLGFVYLELGMPDEASRAFDRAIEIDPQHPVSLAAPLVLDYALQRNGAENLRLATELLENRIDQRRGARFIAMQTLIAGAEDSGNPERLLELLDTLYPHLFDEPPHDLDKNLIGLYFAGRTLMMSGQTERGTLLIEEFVRLAARYDEAYGMNWSTIAAHLLLDDRDAALDAVAEYRGRNGGSFFAQMIFRNDRVFDPIRNEPAFVELLKSFDTQATEQRQLLLASNAG